MKIDLSIRCNGKVYVPQVLENMTWSIERKNTPSKLEFSVLHNPQMKLEEGAEVSLIVDDVKEFKGRIFTLRYTENDEISITAYDQLRYLKANDTYVYQSKTASQVIKMIADDFNLKCGQLASTPVPLSRTEDNKTLFDIINTAIGETTRLTGKVYTLYDKYGELTLSSLDDMFRKDIYLTDETITGYSYVSSIDEDTYNSIKLYYDNDKSGKRDVYIEKDSDNIAKWGLLQYYEKIDKSEDGKTKAGTLLKTYNAPTRKLSFTAVDGIVGLRAGNSLMCNIKSSNGLNVTGRAVITKIKHKYELDKHIMDFEVQI